MTQLSIFDTPTEPLTQFVDEIPYQRHSETSQQAAISHAETARGMEALALRLFRNAGEHGLTDFELREQMNDYESARPRRCGLLKKGLVRDSGRTRSNGRHEMTVWVFSGEGQ